MSRVITTTATAEVNPTSYDTVNYSWYSSSSMSNGYTSETNTTYATINLTRGQNAETYVYWIFDTSSIPNGATITSVSCKAKGYINTTNAQRITARTLQLFTGTTAKGSASTISTSTNVITLSAGSWNLSEIRNARIRIYAKRGTSNTNSNYSMRFYGATLTVIYSYQQTLYTVTSSSSAQGVTITPSSIEKVSGESVTLRIDGNISGVTVTDNGVDITSSFVQKHEQLSTSSVDQVSGTSYYFAWDGNTYYKSNNRGVASSTALSRINLNIDSTANLKMWVVNYAEATYDYGIIGNLDSALSTAQSEDSNKKWSGKNHNSPQEQLITFNSISAGTHFIDVKYFKDQYTDSNNDQLWFRYEIEEINPRGAVYYEYTISNLSADHTIVASGGVMQVLPFRVKRSGSWVIARKVFVKRNGSWSEAIKVLCKHNGTWI